ncbi:hypothetical protein I4F81_011978 [Pyropia yezoensis]|uniref:Uncharacterized protein n=1 Tax=Pyropia yezoensis TaxID=2788 RepID=A0ACC3CIF8_PYRYE|nr:hypothetical protein I4F81_011978 [Neopyropia yezoensis]
MGKAHEVKMAALEQVKAGDLTTAAFARRFGMSYNKARYFILTDGNRLRRGPQPFFTAEEEQVLVKYIRINAFIGRGLSRDAFLTVDALVSAFRRVSRLAPVARKDMARPVVQNGTLSTAGRATILTAPEVISALHKMDADKEEKRTEAEASKRAREERAAEKSTKDAERARAKRARMEDKAARERREIWAVVAAEAASDTGCWLRAAGHTPPSAAKARRRLAAGRMRTPILPPREAWRVAGRDAAQKAMCLFCGRGGGGSRDKA